MRTFSEDDLKRIYRPRKDSHKGQNGRVLVIGGSKLFHSSIFWSADVASRWVDLVHFTSPANENNEAVRTRIKEGFWSGIVVDWREVDEYIKEDDVVLIGPGMPRDEGLMDGERQTGEIVNELLAKFPDKRWVVDGGALQEVDPKLLNGNMIVTPHGREWERLINKIANNQISSTKQSQLSNDQYQNKIELIADFSKRFGGVTVLLKNVEGKDVVVGGDEVVMVEGGNEGLTKGGTGDVLAGLTTAFYAKNEPVLAAAAASYVVKKAADKLYGERGAFYNAGEVVEGVGRVIRLIS